MTKTFWTMMSRRRLLSLFFLIPTLYLQLHASLNAAAPPVPEKPSNYSDAYFFDWVERLKMLVQYNLELRKELTPDKSQGLVKITATEIARTKLDHPVYLVEIRSAGNYKPSDTLFVVSGQHGDEPAGPEGMLTLIEQFAKNTKPSIEEPLRRVTVYIVPVANPDGYLTGTRLTGAGIDMNRDWKMRLAPETKAIWSYIAKLKPLALFDLHENTPNDMVGAYIAITSAKRLSGAVISRALSKKGYRIPVSRRGRIDIRLLHAQFSTTFGRPAYLVETKYHQDPLVNLDKRSEMHLTSVMSIVKYISKQSVPKFEPLPGILQLVRSGNISQLKAFLSKNPSSAKATDKYGANALHYAVQYGRTDVIKLLIEKGAVASAKKVNGITPLHIAADKGNAQAVALLIAAGANPRAADNKGLTPLYLAEIKAQTALVETMLGVPYEAVSE